MSEEFVCIECGRSFVCSYDEQGWFLQRGLAIPKRCHECRSHRRRERDTGMQSVVGPFAAIPTHSTAVPKAPEPHKTLPGVNKELHPVFTPSQKPPGLLSRLREFVKSLLGGSR